MSTRPSPESPRAVPSAGRLRLTVWPQRYGLASLSKLPELANLVTDGAPLAVVVEARESTLLAPIAVLDVVAADAVRRDDGWRALTLDGELPLDAVGVLASLTRALAEASVPVVVFSSFGTDHLLVPEHLLDHALAALAQVTLPGRSR